MGAKLLRRIIRAGIEFAVLVLAFSRAGQVYHLLERLSFLIRFSGVGENIISFASRLNQYSEFIRCSFFSPNASTQAGKYISWQLGPAESVSKAGLVLFILAVTGAFINRSRKICRLALMWLVYSFVILCAIGWGTPENGLILLAVSVCHGRGILHGTW
ncbi:MAG: hypothetical protein II877_02140 [Synergistaceae bacterium]|nr:hypothetical protein [Synergistaceae bacterium]MBQ6970770.1 hypothetical protein [Synergistaceae bacterium]